MEERPTSTRGTLERRPLAHLLVYAWQRELSGSFAFESESTGAYATLLVQAGRPVKLMSGFESVYLGRVLLELGSISQAEHDASLLELAQGGRLHGQILLERGSITPPLLLEGLAEQLKRNLDALFRLPADTTFEFQADADLLDTWGGPDRVPIDPLPRVLGGLRASAPWAMIEPALAALATGKLRLAKGAQLDRLALRPEEKRLIDLLRIKPLSVAEIVANAESLGERGAQLLCYFLAVTRQVEIVTDAELSMDDDEPSWVGRRVSRTPEPPASSSSAALRSAMVGRVQLKSRPIALTPRVVQEQNATTSRDRRATPAPGEVRAVPANSPEVLAARKAEIVQRAEALAAQDHFQVLGVAQDATTEVVKRTFLELARRWHPDRVPKELEAERETVARIFARMSEAHGILGDAQKRAQYVASMAPGATDTLEEQERVADVLEASLSFQKAEVCMKRGDLGGAEELARRAHEYDPVRPEYLALLAWLEALKPDAQGPEPTRAKIQMLDQAIAMNDRLERAYFYRGSLFKRIGEDHSSYYDFKKVVSLNANNIDAAREVRLYEMRHSQPPPPPGASPKEKAKDKPQQSVGFFGRLFKKR